MVRQWREAEGAGGTPLHVTLVDRDAAAVHEQLHHRHPELKAMATIDAYAVDLRSLQFERAPFLFEESGRPSVTHAFVSVDDEGLALSTGLLLLNRLRRFRVPVVVRMNRQAGVAALLHGGLSRGDATAERLHVFSLLDQACQPELLLHGTNELLARALHLEYVSRLPSREGNPAAVPWDELPAEMRESNRTQADHISTKLDSVDCHIVPLTALESESFDFSPDEVERLAVMEHERWVAERRSLGWTAGPRDASKKTNPNLVRWEDLEERIREDNRESVRQLPSFLNRAGFTIRRYRA
jgi:hypothetical protein